MENPKGINPANDLTQGAILPKLLRFAVPLIIANLVMQLYNVVDTIVIGIAVGDHGIAAVGVSMPVMMLFAALFMGASMGGNIVISQMFGAKNMEGLNKAVNTTVFIAFIMGVFITVVGIICVRPLFLLLNTPVEIIDDAVVYQMIIFGGTVGNLFFMLGSGMLRGMGDSRWPLYAMIIATLLNIVFDTLFAIILGWGVAGVAWATLGAQFVSGIVLLMRINTGVYGMKISFSKVIRPDGFTAKHIIRLGLPTGLQAMAMSLGGLIVQRFANNFGADFVTANAVIQRVDGFALMPLMGLGMATTTFTGQNIGAGDPERAQKGVYVALGTIISVAVVMGVVMWFAGASLMRIFNVSDHVLEIGLKGIRTICFFYAFMGTEQCLAGSLRGAGAAMPPLVNSFAAQIVRLLAAYYFAIIPLNKVIQAAVDAGRYATFALAKAAGVGMDGYMPMYLTMAFGMTLGALLNFLYFRYGNWQNKGLEQRRGGPGGPPIPPGGPMLQDAPGAAETPLPEAEA